MKNKIICFGEIMLRLSPPNHQKIEQADTFNATYGGAEANVAVSLAHFDQSVSFVSRIPENQLGDTAIAQLRKHGVDTKNIVRGGERLGSYFLEIGVMHRTSQVVYDRAYSGFATLKENTIDWIKVFEGAEWLHWSGISPAVSATAAKVCFEALSAAKKKGLTVSCDLNYRSKLWKYGKGPKEIMPQLIELTDIVLGGKEDARIMLGVEFEENDGYDSAPRRIKEHFPHLKMVATSLRKSYSASHNNISGVLFDGIEEFRSTAYDMPFMIDRVGGGDAYMAGLIYGFINYTDDPQKIIDFAAAASCLKHTIHGDASLTKVSEVEGIMGGKDAGLVSR
ncbi:sugar kinase [Flammeovirga sp. SJP92]|uniref:sugar kinase n=1 Tax=Flammeovirga sp. SJP92 TaxID=1775430 RepID=UPI00079578A2|nr:sugar kinase [Flammeovirga sp. SJP92]KXX71598.1 2-dehydro-3-deoxygluconokinase [Flammeovirga sp. SJP92]